MAEKGYNWVIDGDKWKKTYNSTVDWASELDTEKITNSIKEGAVWVRDNPRKIGTTFIEINPYVLKSGPYNF